MSDLVTWPGHMLWVVPLSNNWSPPGIFDIFGIRGSQPQPLHFATKKLGNGDQPNIYCICFRSQSAGLSFEVYETLRPLNPEVEPLQP